MNIVDFKERIKSLKEANKVHKKTVNIITPTGNVNGVQQASSHTLIYTKLDDSVRANLTPNLKKQALKMLNWRDVKADYYVWLDSDITLLNSKAVDWMINNIIMTPFTANFFQCHERSSISEEVEYICNDCDTNNALCLEAKSQIKGYVDDITFADNSLYLTSAFIFKGELVAEEGFNLMLDWYLETASRGGVDQLSLPYLLHKHDTPFGTFDECMMTNNYMRSMKYIEVPQEVISRGKELVVERVLVKGYTGNTTTSNPTVFSVDTDE